MTGKPGRPVERHGHRRRADRQVGRIDADEIDQQRHRKNRPASADETEHEPDQRTGERASDKKGLSA